MRSLLAGLLTGVIVVSCGFRITDWQFWLLVIYVPVYGGFIQEWINEEKRK